MFNKMVQILIKVIDRH